jgi:hypothetical protein
MAVMARKRVVVILADHMLPFPRSRDDDPGTQASAMKPTFETCFLLKSRNGYVRLR